MKILVVSTAAIGLSAMVHAASAFCLPRPSATSTSSSTTRTLVPPPSVEFLPRHHTWCCSHHVSFTTRRPSKLSASFGAPESPRQQQSEDDLQRDGPIDDDDDDDTTKKPSPFVDLAWSPLGAITLLSCIVLFHELGHYVTAKSMGVTVDEFSVGIGPKLLGLQLPFSSGDPFSLRALPLGGYVRLNLASLAILPWFLRMEILAAGVLFNLLLSFLIYTGLILVGDKGLPAAVFDRGIAVSGMDKGAPAQGLLRPGDVIEAVNGKSLLTAPTMSELQVNRAISKLIDEVQATPDGESVIFTVLQSKTGRVKNVPVKPQESQKLSGKRTVGVYLSPNYIGVDSRKKTDNPLDAAAWSASQVATMTKDTVIGLWVFAGDVLQGKAASSEYRLSGPVAVVKRASNIVKTQEWETVFKYAAAASINLAVLNCFPIPPSDGFQILMTGLQAFWSTVFS